jgi:hypothetical protein
MVLMASINPQMFHQEKVYKKRKENNYTIIVYDFIYFWVIPTPT